MDLISVVLDLPYTHGAIYRYWWSVEYKTEYKYIDKILQPKGFYQN